MTNNPSPITNQGPRLTAVGSWRDGRVTFDLLRIGQARGLVRRINNRRLHPVFAAFVYGWHYDQPTRTVHLFMVENCCADQHGTTKFFEATYPDADTIKTWSGNLPDTTYCRKGWKDWDAQ